MRCANFIVKKPMVIGHECAGIIEEVGSKVKSLAVGDRVALEPGISCQRCNLCREGRYNLCPEMKFFGSPPTNGSLANKVIGIFIQFIMAKTSAHLLDKREHVFNLFFFFFCSLISGCASCRSVF